MNNRDTNHEVTEPHVDQTTETRNDVAADELEVEPLDMLVRWARDEILAAANMTIAPPQTLERQLADMGDVDLSN